MAPDDDLAKLLPEAPPRPDRREAAIAEAMRRFDGEAPVPVRRHIRWTRPSWTKIGRVQLGVLVSMAVVAVIGVPVSLQIAREQASDMPPIQLASREKPAASSSQSLPGKPAESAPPAATAGHPTPPPVALGANLQIRQPEGRVAKDQSEAVSAKSPTAAEPAQSALAGMSTAQVEAALNRLPQFKAAGSPASVSPAPDRLTKLADASAQNVAAPTAPAQPVVITGSRIMRRDNTANSPVVTVDQTFLQQSSVSAIERELPQAGVANGAVSPADAKIARRGDWNACTVDDPEHSLGPCTKEINSGSKGEGGPAAVSIAEGLDKAWAGDMKGAIAAFDAAIDASPKFAFAYLNRGLAHRRLGELKPAIKDLDRAIRYAPRDARGYYHRSLALRAIGDEDRAKTDEAKAVRLDPRYAELFN